MFAFTVSVLMCACGANNTDNRSVAEIDNVFGDATLRKITELRCQENSAGLVSYFRNQPAIYTRATAMALASMRDSMAATSVASLLHETDREVRMSALFALGQIGHCTAERSLIDFFETANGSDLKAASMEAMGKCGGEESLRLLDTLSIPHSDVVMVSGHCRAMVWLASRGMHSLGFAQKAMEYLGDSTIHEKARMLAAEYFAVCGADLTNYTDGIISAYSASTYPGLKLKLVQTLGKCHNERALNLARSIADSSDADTQVRCAAIEALISYPYFDGKKAVMNALLSADCNVSECAASYICRKGIEADSSLYLDLSRNVTHWQSRTRLLQAALKFCRNKQVAANRIQSGFNASRNMFEKAAFLHALACDFANFGFIENCISESPDDYIRLEGVKALIEMYEMPGFARQAARLHVDSSSMVEDFSIAFKNVVINGNTPMMALAASVIARHPEIAERYGNTYFLNQAADKCELPREMDTYLVIKDAVKTVTGATVYQPGEDLALEPDWAYIKTIPAECLVDVVTEKGSFCIKLDVQAAPMSVSGFLKLVDDHYFDKSYFARDTHGMVCNYGSFSGYDESKSLMIPSELNPLGAEEGVVSLITTPRYYSCTSQWGISLSANTLAGGASSAVGSVVEGMDVVSALSTGDMIVSMHRR